jgi:hypothetical protein
VREEKKLESPLRKINFNGHMENKTLLANVRWAKKKVFDDAADDADGVDGGNIPKKQT